MSGETNSSSPASNIESLKVDGAVDSTSTLSIGSELKIQPIVPKPYPELWQANPNPYAQGSLWGLNSTPYNTMHSEFYYPPHHHSSYCYPSIPLGYTQGVSDYTSYSYGQIPIPTSTYNGIPMPPQQPPPPK